MHVMPSLIPFTSSLISSFLSLLSPPHLPLSSIPPTALFSSYLPSFLLSSYAPLASLHSLHLIILLSPSFIPPSIKSISAVLVLSYKNHALDEFLCDVLEFSPGFKQRGHLIRTGKPERPELMNHTEQ